MSTPSAPVTIDRSDVDPHQKVSLDDLGEDWGGGFHVEAEPVFVLRDQHGHIAKTIPVGEAISRRQELREAWEDSAPPVVQPTMVVPRPLPTSEREKLVFILAKRLFDWYANQPREFGFLNPLYDGIPTCHNHPRGCPYACPHGRRTLAEPARVLEYLEQVIAARVRVVNSKHRWRGWRPDLGDTITITRDIGGQ